MTASTSINGTAETSAGVSRRLGLKSAIMIGIGIVIGSGIFLMPANIAAAVQVQGVMMCVWKLAGLLTLVFIYGIFAGWISFVLDADAVLLFVQRYLPPTSRFMYLDACGYRLYSFLRPRDYS
jgi:APA family basic amino acid/polyamine antiporter